jgi:DNA-binding MarR family transcriptional regulator
MGNDADAITDLFATLGFGSPDRAVGFVLWRVLHRYIREADRVLADFGLTHLQFQTLALAAWLSRTGEAVNQAELARSGDMSAMQVSQMMKALERNGCVRRTPSSTDVRAKNVEITDKGLTTLRTALPQMVDLQRRLFGEEGAPGGSLLTALHRAEAGPES